MALKKSFFQTANIIFLSILLYYKQYLEENRNKESKKRKISYTIIRYICKIIPTRKTI